MLIHHLGNRGRFVKTSLRMHECAYSNCNCIGRQQAYLLQCLVLSSLVNDHITSTLLHLLLDEAKEVFLVHARGSVDVSIHLHSEVG